MKDQYIAVWSSGSSSSDVGSTILEDGVDLVDFIIDIFGLSNLKWSDVHTEFPFPHIEDDNDDIEFDFSDIEKWCEAAIQYNYESNPRIIEIIRVTGQNVTFDQF